jgi:hypothetical protein
MRTTTTAPSHPSARSGPTGGRAAGARALQARRCGGARPQCVRAAARAESEAAYVLPRRDDFSGQWAVVGWQCRVILAAGPQAARTCRPCAVCHVARAHGRPYLTRSGRRAAAARIPLSMCVPGPPPRPA